MGSITIIFFTSLLLFNGGNSQNPPNPQCPSFDCGDGIKISYPFWRQTQNSDQFCGYPNFNISCIDHNPILNLPNNNNYPIKHINYTNKSLTLSLNFPQNSTCPKLPSNFSSTTELFPFTYSDLGTTMLYFFYNCSLYPPSVMQIRCLTNGPKRSFVFREGAVPEFDWRSYCESSVVVPASEEAAGNGDLAEDFGRLLRDGFKLRWRNSDGVCESCEDGGGFCVYGGDGRSSCSNGSDRVNANSTAHFDSDQKGSDSVEGEIKYAAIGAVLFAGMVIMAIVFYFVQKKRSIASYKPV